MIEKQQIEEDEVVTVLDSLTVKGKIGSGAKIMLKNSSKPCELIIQGRVHDNVQINWIGNIKFEEDLGNNIKVENSEGTIISEKNLGGGTSFTMHKGTIKVDSTAKGCTLLNYCGDITLKKLLASNLIVNKGMVFVTIFGNQSKLTVCEGNVTIEKHEKEELEHSEDAIGEITINKGNLTTSSYIKSHLNCMLYRGEIIINNNDQIARTFGPSSR